MQTNQVPQWALKPGGGAVIYDGAPRQYHFDGLRGVFLIGEKEIGPTLPVQIFDRRLVEGERWGRPSQTWVDLAFVDDNQVVSVLALKKESAINLLEWFLTELRLTNASEVDPTAVRLVLAAERREGEEDEYFVVQPNGYSFVSEEQYHRVRQWTDEHLFRWIFLGEGGV